MLKGSGKIIFGDLKIGQKGPIEITPKQTSYNC
jgi:hypothetical protein